MSIGSISVVIPSVLRAELPEAISSVRDQAGAEVAEIIVVVDKSPDAVTSEELARTEGASHVLFTGGGRRAGFARNLGVREARGEWVGFLDDDDEWSPERVSIHEQALDRVSNPSRTIFSTRVAQSIRGSQDPMRVTPDDVMSHGARVEDYLFRARKPSIGRAGMFTSTLIVPKALAQEVPWDETLARHQDWDWLYRLQRDGGAAVDQSDRVGAIIWIGSDGSISASSDWNGSLQWARRYAAEWNRKTYVDFVTGQTLRYATQARSLRGIRETLGEILRSRAVPSFGPIVIGASGLAPRRFAMRAALRSDKSRATSSSS